MGLEEGGGGGAGDGAMPKSDSWLHALFSTQPQTQTHTHAYFGTYIHIENFEIMLVSKLLTDKFDLFLLFGPNSRFALGLLYRRICGPSMCCLEIIRENRILFNEYPSIEIKRIINSIVGQTYRLPGNRQMRGRGKYGRNIAARNRGLKRLTLC